MEIHEAANIFPMITGTDFASLRDDIKANGLLEPIILCDGKILDGRNRYAACLDVGIEPAYQDYNGEQTPLDYVISKNLHRRHLNETQRAVVASKIANIQNGGDRRSDQIANLQSEKITQQKAAAMLNVSPRTVASVKEIERKAPELMPKLASGEMTTNEARTTIRRFEQVAQAVALSSPELPKKKYSVICGDPPWRYDYSLTSNRDIENQYPTMEIDEICALDIAGLCADDCVIFLWATNPKLQEAMRVLVEWGFEYKTNMVWVKDKIGMGYYARQRHELLLIGTRGSLANPLPENRPDSVISADRTEHSRKPDIVFDIIDKMYPGIPKLELFARGKREGWDTWGNQA